LIAPDNQSTQTSSPTVEFAFIPVEDWALKNATLYANFTGSWKLNASNSTALTNNSINTISVDLPNGYYIWNIRVCDNLLQCSFNSTTNYSFKLAYAQPGGIVINDPIYNFLQGRNATFLASVVTSSGIRLSGGQCNISIYWPNNSLRGTYAMGENVSGDYIYYGVYSRVGTYNYNITCASGTSTGAFPGFFTVSFTQDTGMLGLIFVIVGLIILVIASGSETLELPMTILGLMFFTFATYSFGVEQPTFMNAYMAASLALTALVLLSIAYFLLNLLFKTVEEGFE
jgi:predicted secreted protein